MDCSEPVEKNLVNRTLFNWVTALWNMYINGQKWVFLEKLQKILTFEYYAKKEKKRKIYVCAVCLDRDVTHSWETGEIRTTTTGSRGHQPTLWPTDLLHGKWARLAESETNLWLLDINCQCILTERSSCLLEKSQIYPSIWCR